MWKWEEEVPGGDTKKGVEAPNKEVDHGYFSSGSHDHTEMFPPPMVHMNPLQYPSSNMNLLSWSSAIFSSSSSSLATTPLPSSSSRVYHHVDRPSDHTSTLPHEQDKEMKAGNEGLFPRTSSSGLEPEASSVHKKSGFFLQKEDQNGEAEAILGCDFLEKCSEETREIIELNLKL